MTAARFHIVHTRSLHYAHSSISRRLLRPSSLRSAGTMCNDRINWFARVGLFDIEWNRTNKEKPQ